MTDKFTWRVHATASGAGDFSTAKAQFGDGYAQESAVGLNPEVQKWNVTVSGFKADLTPVMTFIRSHVGIAFFWTPPMGVQGKYKCKRYSGPSDQGSGYFTISFDFEQVFTP